MELDKRVLEVADVIFNDVAVLLDQETHLSENQQKVLNLTLPQRERLFATYDRYEALPVPSDQMQRQEQLKASLHNLRTPISFLATASDYLDQNDKSQWSEESKIVWMHLRQNLQHLLHVINELAAQ